MAVRAAAKRTSGRAGRLECAVVGVRSAFEPRRASFDPSASPLWSVTGEVGPNPLSPRALDLLDLAGGIYRLESSIPLRPTNAAIEWQVAAPVRDIRFWRDEGADHLASVLGFLNRARWTFRFEPRRKGAEIALPATSARPVREVLLFSGGMDSACGAGVHHGPLEQVQLVSFSSSIQHALQQRLATELRYPGLTQFRLQGRRGKEGMDLIRAFMFLTLAGVSAASFGASTLFQYENGVLAMAIPPSGSLVPTRHAHPELHRRLRALFEAVFERPFDIRNPFALLTKREEAVQFAGARGEDFAEGILRQTQTCWRLAQAHVAGHPKRPFAPCGVCAPCIVRRTARPQEAAKEAWKGWPGYAFDLKKSSVLRDEKLSLTFRAYLELIDIVLESDERTMIEELAPEARALIGGIAGPTREEAVGVLRRFAREFCETFEIRVPGNR